MHARSLVSPSCRDAAPPWLETRRPSAAALHFLRGRDADGRLRELATARAAARPVLGTLASELLRRKLFEHLGYRSLGDYAREHLGVGGRTVREWARVWRGLEGLPALRSAVVGGEVSWSVARQVVGLVTAETEEACLATVRGRTLRAVEAIVAVVKEAQTGEGQAQRAEAANERVVVRLRCTGEEALLWHAAVELARRVAGEEILVWQCAEAIAAEFSSAASGAGAVGSAEGTDVPPGQRRPSARDASGPLEHGRREEAFPHVPWRARPPVPAGPLAGLSDDLAEASARELDRRLRTAMAFLQGIDLETGRILREIVDRGLCREIGFESVERYAAERLDLSARTARRLVALARTGRRAPVVGRAFGEGTLSAFQAHALARVADRASAEAWVERARAVTLRRLEDEVAARAEASGRPAVIAFRAPAEVAASFRAAIARAGSLEALLAHAIATWAQAGGLFEDYADFERDGFRCTVPGCTARRNLHSHHIRFRSAGGADAPWNRTTLCAVHHQRGVHGGTLGIRGRAPDALVYELGRAPAECFFSGDVRLEPSQRL